jgi:predicted transcriptional regulator
MKPSGNILNALPSLLKNLLKKNQSAYSSDDITLEISLLTGWKKKTAQNWIAELNFMGFIKKCNGQEAYEITKKFIEFVKR